MGRERAEPQPVRQPVATLNMQRVSMKVLVDAPYNPRVMDDQAREGLAASLDHYGYLQPIVWNKRTGHVVGGHQRKHKLAEDGVQEVDVVVVDMDEAAEKALNIALNSQFITGQWDYEKLGALVKGMEDSLRAVTFLAPHDLDVLTNVDFNPAQALADLGEETPKGGTKFVVTCPKCGHEFEK